jgi:hypothetical protein
MYLKESVNNTRPERKTKAEVWRGMLCIFQIPSPPEMTDHYFIAGFTLPTT